MAEGSNALSVSAALGIAKKQLEDITVRIVGEVSEVSANPRYKAVYFTLKDEKSSLPCMIWNNRYASCGVDLQVGSLVEATGRFTLYAAKGRMNFDAFSLELAGEGKLRMQVANLAKRLEGEGLMASERKKPLPAFPSRIGLVTSPRGAAVYDVLRTLRRRYPLSEVVFAGVGVEGKDAPAGIMHGLDVVADAGVDVVLLVRGGGSFEDLMPFNDEALARHIASMDVPVVTGIGHEPDTSIADLVADFRASTPTAAAESVAPAASDVMSSLRDSSRRMHQSVAGRLASTGRSLDKYALLPLFQEPMRLFQDDAQQLDELTRRLAEAIPSDLRQKQERLNRVRVALKMGISGLVPPLHGRLSQAKAQVAGCGKSIVEPFKRGIAAESAALQALSPLAVLSRGYSIARNEKGVVVKKANQIEKGDPMSVQVSDGVVECRVEGIKMQSLALEDIND